MNQVSKATLTLATLGAVFAMATACASGGDEDDGNKGGSSSNNGGSTANNGGSTANNGGSTANNGGSTANNGGSTANNGGSTANNGGSTANNGGTGGSSSTPSVCDGMTTTLLPTQTYVENFENEDRKDGWYTFSDTAPPKDTPNKPIYEAGGALATGTSAHIAVTGITAPTGGGYGAGIGFNLVDPALEKCIDLSEFDGISFWAKGTAGADDTVQFQAVVPETAPTKDGGDCPMIDEDTPAASCYLHPAAKIQLTADWKQYTIKFTDLKAKTAKWKGLILGFNMITPGPAWDISLDEVSFYTGTASTDPVLPPEGAGGATQ